MLEIEKLNEKYRIEGEVGFARPKNDLVFIIISNKYAAANICLYGAHVTSFRLRNTTDLLWLSSESLFEEGKPIRGGIPVCFPWFGPHKTDFEKPQHGFARLMNWKVIKTASNPGGETTVALQLCSSNETRAYWPHDFCAEITVTVGRRLTATLKVTNTSAATFDYTCALHTYYSLSALENLTVEGLHGTTYYNQLTGESGIQEKEKLQIHEPLTRHYLNTEIPVVIDDTGFRRRIIAGKTGSKVTTVWNPGEEACAKISDLPDDGYKTFVCVEATNAFGFPVSLVPGQFHETSVIIGMEE